MTRAEEVKNKLRGMIDRVNELTGESDTNLASAVDTLVATGAPEANRAEAAAVRSETAATEAEAASASAEDSAETTKVYVNDARESANQAITAAQRAESIVETNSEAAAQAAIAKADEVIAQRVAELGVVQSTGSSPTAVMSQKAVTKEVYAIKDAIGIQHPIAEGIADARTPAYDFIQVADGIAIEKGKKYILKVKVETTSSKFGVYIGVAKSDNTWVGANFHINQPAENGEASFEYTAPDNHTGLCMVYQTGNTSGLSVYASFSEKDAKLVTLVTDENILQTACGDMLAYMNFNAKHFIHGDSMFWGGGTQIATQSKYRISCLQDKFYQFPKDVTIKASEGYRFAVGYYSDGVLTSDEGWNTEKIIPANTQFRIMIGKVNENTSETADINEWTKNVVVLADVLVDILRKVNTNEEVVVNFNNAPAIPFEVLSINHRGFNTIAPENTLHAYKLSKKKGFDLVEADIRFTSDNVPVLLHDPTINRTARTADGSTITSTINIKDITYQQALTYDFGVWKGPEYAGTKIPTLDEFLRLCRALSLHPYLDVYDCSANGAETIKNIIYSCGIERNITLISSNYTALNNLADKMPDLRYGIVTWNANTSSSVSEVASLKNRGVNNIFIDIDTTLCDIGAYKAVCQENGVALEVYSPNTEAEILALDPFVTGVTSDLLVAKQVLLDGNLD